MRSAASKAVERRVRFGDVVRLCTDRCSDPVAAGTERYVGLEHLEPGDLRVRKWGLVAEGTTFTNRFKPGQVLFGKRRAYQRKVAVADFEGVCSGDIYVLEPADAALHPDLLPFLCQTDAFFDHAIGTSAGSLSPRTTWKSLADFEFVLPSIAEQRSLAAALSAAWGCIAAQDDARAAGQRVRQALIFFLYQGGGCDGPRRSTPLGELPASWEVVPLGDRYEVQLGKMISETARGGRDQTPYIRNANVQWNRLELDDVATMSFSPKEQKKFELRYGDILACEGRHVGKSALWRNEMPGACYQKALHRLRRLSDRDVPEYMLHCLQYYSWAGRFVAETGETTIPHLAAERFRAMHFPFPPHGQQERIAATVAACDTAIQGMEGRGESSRTLLKKLYRSLENG